jgi:hypothetical protein
MAVIHWGMCYPHQQKIPKYCLTVSAGGFEYGTTVVFNPSTKGSAIGSISYETKYLHEICKQDTDFCSKCGAVKCKNVRATKNDSV